MNLELITTEMINAAASDKVLSRNAKQNREVFALRCGKSPELIEKVLASMISIGIEIGLTIAEMQRRSDA